MHNDWLQNDPEHMPWFIGIVDDFQAFVHKLQGFSRGEGLGEGYVANTTFWLSDGNQRILGAINIRHELNDALRGFGGQMGYGIRPGERRKGYAKELLRLGLIEAGKLGLRQVLICCYKDNTGSVKTIEANGGVLEDETEDNGRIVRKYWIQC